MFDINLLEQKVNPPRRRKLKHVAMHFYLLAWGIVLTGTAYVATGRLVEASWRRREMNQVEQQFHAGHSGAKSMDDYAEALEGKLKLVNKTLESMNQELDKRTALAEILFGLAVCLPEDSYLANAAWDATDPENRLTFDVIAASRYGASAMQPERLIRKWQNEPTLDGRVDSIISTATEKRHVGDTSTSVFRFVCHLAKEKR